MKHRRWAREELLLALRLYWRTPFGQQHGRHPPIVALAELLGRTPGSVAMKLNNFTSLDLAERERGVVGLSGASQLDRTIWDEYQERPLEVVDAMEEVAEKLNTSPDPIFPDGPTESMANVKVRRQQGFFRRTVLSNYGFRCALTGNPMSELLRASHIVPWAADASNRVNPRNGICLNALHDAAFDRGLITFDKLFRLKASRRLSEHFCHRGVAENFQALVGQSLQMPEKNLPHPDLLQRHRDEVFQG